MLYFTSSLYWVLNADGKVSAPTKSYKLEITFVTENLRSEKTFTIKWEYYLIVKDNRLYWRPPFRLTLNNKQRSIVVSMTIVWHCVSNLYICLQTQQLMTSNNIAGFNLSLSPPPLSLTLSLSIPLSLSPLSLSPVYNLFNTCENMIHLTLKTITIYLITV